MVKLRVTKTNNKCGRFYLFNETTGSINRLEIYFKQDVVYISALQGHNQRSGLFQKLLDQAARCPPLQYDFKWRKKLKSIDFKWWF